MIPFKKYCLFLLFLGSFIQSSCDLLSISPNFHQPDKAAVIRFQLRVADCTLDQLATVQTQITSRLQDERVFYKNISIDSSKQSLTVELIGFEDKTQPTESLQSLFLKSPDLKIITAARVDDPAIQKIISGFQEIDSLIRHLDLNSPAFPLPDAALGVCRTKDYPYLKNLLEQYEQKLRYKFVWELTEYPSPNPTKNSGYFLYAYKKTDRTLISNEQLASAEASINQLNTPQITIAFNAEGAKQFSKMTLSAANDMNRALLFLLDGQVTSAPRVNEPIIGGRAVISGDFTMIETVALARQLRQSLLACPLEIVSEELL